MESSTLEQSQQNQYSLQSILWITAAVAMLLAYARQLGPESTRVLIVCVVFWLTSSIVFSWVGRRAKDVFFWTGLIVIEGYLAVTGMRVFSASQAIGWGLVGAVCGGFCTARPVTQPWAGSLISAVLGSLAMASVLAWFRQQMDLESWLDLFGAACVGGALWFFVDWMRKFQLIGRQPPAVMAAWLTISVLLGKLLVHRLGY